MPLIAYLAFVGIKLTIYHLDISRFIAAGDHFVTRSQLVQPIAVETNSDGYDGQFFYRMALDPTTTKRVDYGISMQNHPVVRVQRILYPASAWAVSFGRATAIPYALVALNLLSMAGVAWIAVQLADGFGVSRRLALLIPFYPGFILSIGRDLAEIPATALALGSLLMASRQRWPVAALLASAAVMTRESTLLYLVGYGLIAVASSIGRRTFDRRIWWCMVPLTVYVGWQVTLKSIWGQYGFEVIGNDDLSSFPLVDYARALASDAVMLASSPIRFRTVYLFATSVSVAAFVVFIAVNLARQRRLEHLPIEFVVPWCLYVAMATLFTHAIWRDPWGYLRILCDVYALGIVTLMALGKRPALRRLAPFVAVTWAASFAAVL